MTVLDFLSAAASEAFSLRASKNERNRIQMEALSTYKFEIHLASRLQIGELF